MASKIGAREARKNFADLLGRVGYGGEVTIVTRFDRPLVALIPVEIYERMIAEREARFQILDKIRQRLPEISDEELERDVREALEAARGVDAKGRS
jgi:prevent-host-death family protein